MSPQYEEVLQIDGRDQLHDDTTAERKIESQNEARCSGADLELPKDLSLPSDGAADALTKVVVKSATDEEVTLAVEPCKDDSE